MIINRITLLSAIAFFLTACGGSGGNKDQDHEKSEKQKSQKQEVNVYSHRHYEVDEMLFDQFTEETGIEVNVVNASADELMKKLEMEGKNSPADVLISVDAGRLYRAKDRGLLQKVESETLTENIPAQFRDDKGFWYGLAYRGRIITYHKDRVNSGAISTYEDLTKPKWKDRVLIRSSENIYNQSLMASIIAHKGEEKARQWAEGIVENMARKPKGGDRDQMKAVAAGTGDLAVVNTYYLGHLLNSQEEAEVKVGKQMGVVFPNQNGRGTHVNLSGAGVTKHAPNKKNALKLLKFLTSKEAQAKFSSVNYEYPVREGVEKAPVLEKWGDFKIDTLDLNELGKLNRKAVKIMDKAGWK